MVHDIVHLARTSAPEILMRLIDMASGRIDGVDFGTQCKAATAVLDRAYGKPLQPTDVTSNGEQITQPRIMVTLIQPNDPTELTVASKAIASLNQHRQ
jgi:hypothetical protein